MTLCLENQLQKVAGWGRKASFKPNIMYQSPDSGLLGWVAMGMGAEPDGTHSVSISVLPPRFHPVIQNKDWCAHYTDEEMRPQEVE